MNATVGDEEPEASEGSSEAGNPWGALWVLAIGLGMIVLDGLRRSNSDLVAS